MIAGLVLAAGAGLRAGGPKALLPDPVYRTCLRRAAASLAVGGCDCVLVAVGAGGEQVEAEVPDYAIRVPVPDWAEGMAAALHRGVAEALSTAPDLRAVVVTLVDLPDVDHRAVRRVLAACGPVNRQTLARAGWRGRPGHPVLVGADHLAGLLDAAHGDTGGRAFLDGSGDQVLLVECGDLGTGDDVDTRP